MLPRALDAVRGVAGGGGVRQQQTLAERVSCTGTGLHSGAPVRLELLPAREGTGIVFVRTDRTHPVEIPARPGGVTSTRLATTLGSGAASVATVEHLLAALYGLGIDNVRVSVDGPELPVMDGSAASFVYLIRSAGIRVQREPRAVLRVLAPIEVDEGDRRIRIEPARGLRISYAVDFAHPAIGRQELKLDRLDAQRFETEIASARTFGFLQDVRALWSAGLAQGGSLHNTVLLDETRVMNPRRSALAGRVRAPQGARPARRSRAARGRDRRAREGRVRRARAAPPPGRGPARPPEGLAPARSRRAPRPRPGPAAHARLTWLDARSPSPATARASLRRGGGEAKRAASRRRAESGRRGPLPRRDP